MDKWAKSGKLATTRCSSANRNDFGSKEQRLLLGHQTVTEDRFMPQLYHKATLRHQTRTEFLKPPLMPVEFPSQHMTAGRRHTGDVRKCPLNHCLKNTKFVRALFELFYSTGAVINTCHTLLKLTLNRTATVLGVIAIYSRW
jgi:hypothetical protein